MLLILGKGFLRLQADFGWKQSWSLSLEPGNAFEAGLIMKEDHPKRALCVFSNVVLFHKPQHSVGHCQCMRREAEVKSLEIWFRGSREMKAVCYTCD